ncbi:hypothetical protein [Phenylobacterium soli]|uniref:Uncharacterized protein n=1 Tax=Phenylobacterium soli TaxID=2170551 RepID=A0A328AKA8_9CAUL|nr:hypothetical protein [Phenylobacterium soli]RAK54825.1 hypothetical protein DJ017_09955 [Phenylobacterium soli]
MSGEPVIVGAEIAAGHDGSAELVVRLRYPNGAEGAVTLDEETGLKLMQTSGAEKVEDLAGKSWRAIVGKD